MCEKCRHTLSAADISARNPTERSAAASEDAHRDNPPTTVIRQYRLFRYLAAHGSCRSARRRTPSFMPRTRPFPAASAGKLSLETTLSPTSALQYRGPAPVSDAIRSGKKVRAHHHRSFDRVSTYTFANTRPHPVSSQASAAGHLRNRIFVICDGTDRPSMDSPARLATSSPW